MTTPRATIRARFVGVDGFYEDQPLKRGWKVSWLAKLWDPGARRRTTIVAV
jgi:hypothetical protein